MSDVLNNTKVCMILMGGLLHDGRVRKESTSLCRQGCDVTILTMPRTSEGQAGLKGVTVEEIILKTRPLSIGVVGVVAKYLEFVIRATTKAVKTKADVYHAHDLPTLLPAYIAARFRGSLLVYDAHELFTECGTAFTDNWVWRRLERWLIKKVDGILTTNKSRADIIHSEYGANVEPIPVYNCPVINKPSDDTLLLRDFVRQKLPDFRNIVLYQGAISGSRQCEELIDAVKDLDEGTVVVFLGYGSPESYIDVLKSRAADQGVAERVLFHPAVPNDVIVDYTRSADVGVVFYKATCRNNYYCASNKLFDFLAVGAPIVGSDIPGINEIVEDRNVGITVDSANPREISRAINELFRDRVLYDQRRENALRLGRDQFNWGHQEQILLGFYRTLLA